MSIVRVNDKYIQCFGLTNMGHVFNFATSRDNASRLIDHVAVNVLNVVRQQFPDKEIEVIHV